MCVELVAGSSNVVRCASCEPIGQDPVRQGVEPREPTRSYLTYLHLYMQIYQNICFIQTCREIHYDLLNDHCWSRHNFRQLQDSFNPRKQRAWSIWAGWTKRLPSCSTRKGATWTPQLSTSWGHFPCFACVFVGILPIDSCMEL